LYIAIRDNWGVINKKTKTKIPTPIIPLLTINSVPAGRPAPDTPSGVSPLYGAGVSPGSPGRAPRTPGPGRPLRTPAGNRGAPARGVDVKPSPGEAREGPPGAGKGLRRPPDPVRDPGGGPGWPGAPGRPRDPVPGPRARGVLHQPLAPGPRGTRRGPGGPSGAREPETPVSRGYPQNPQKRGFWALFQPDPQNPEKGVTGAPARGVDVKPLSKRAPGSGKCPKRAIFPKIGVKPLFWPKMPKKGIFRRFRPLRGLPDPSRYRGFTSTPRGGAPVAPREPREGPGDASPVQGRGQAPIGALGGLPPGEA